MSKLSDRIEKANKLVFSEIPGVKTTTGGTWGSRNDYYQVSLFQKKQWEKVRIAEQIVKAIVVCTCCQVLNPENGKLNPMERCPGNCRHTVCYHSLGFLKYQLAQRNKHISYFENILDALNGLNFGGQLTKIISKQGEGFVWAVVRDAENKTQEEKEEKDTLPMQSDHKNYYAGIGSPQENIRIMRGQEEEGID